MTQGEQSVTAARLADGPSAAPRPREWQWLDAVLPRLAELGLTTTLFDAAGQPVRTGLPPCELNALVTGPSSPCPLGRHVAEALKKPRTTELVSCVPGLSCLLLPIARRRRLQGVMVVHLACTDMPDSEELAHFCQACRLDRELTLRQVRKAARFSSQQADAVRALCRMLLEQAFTLQVQRDDLTELSTNLTNTYEELNLTYKIAAGMTVTEKPTDYLQTMASDLLEVIGVQSLAIRWFNPDQPDVSEHISVGADLLSPQVEQTLWDELLRRLEGRPDELLSNTVQSDQSPLLDALAGNRRVRQLAARPMMHNGRLVGALLAINKLAGDFDSGDLKLMKSIGDEATVFLANSFLYDDLQQLLVGMLRALTSSIDAKDPYTCGHSERVAVIASKVAVALGLDEHTVRRVHLSGLLHDIGKIGVPEAVLTKPGRLNKEEYGLMRKHPEIGSKILGDIKQVQDLISGVMCHHERIDGKGYPQGLAGDKIPLFGRIVGLADCFDAMTSNRTYRRALPLEVTLTEIRRYSGTQFDPRMVEAFLTLEPEELLRQTRATGPADPLSSVVRGVATVTI